MLEGVLANMLRICSMETLYMAVETVLDGDLLHVGGSVR